MERFHGLNLETFSSFVDNMYDEIIVYDRNFTVVYVNKASMRHYGCRPEQMIGKNFYDLIYAGWWKPSILPVVAKEKRTCSIRQKTFLGTELLTIAVPILDDKGEVAYIVMNVRDSVNEENIYNSEYNSARLSEVLSNVTVVGESPEMKELIQTVRRIAPLSPSCIFYGEPGTGKTVLARYLHSVSQRKDQVFGTFNCAGIGDEQLMLELFGDSDTLGLLDKMRTGTLLLKNISRLCKQAQYRLVQFFNNIQVGSYHQVRILASSTENLRHLVEKGTFSEELYYRLNVVEIEVPPLRCRQEDIRPLIDYFTSMYCAQYQVQREFTPGAIQAMMHADWPNNVTELRHAVQKLLLTGESPEIDVECVTQELFGIRQQGEERDQIQTENFDFRMAVYESSLIHDAYKKYGSSRRIAKHLGISQTRANNLIRKYIRTEDTGRTK